MRKIYILLLFIFSNYTIYSQTISGIITDKILNEELIGVNIILENGNGTATDVFGKYNLKTEEGTQTITFRYIGYEDLIKEITIRKGENKVLNISLKPTSEQLSTVVVSAGRFEQKIEEITVSMEVIKPSLIENKNTTDVQTVMDQVPGVNITDGQANIRGGSGWSYGAGTRVLVMVDDMPLISGDAGQVQWKLIATENIHQIEVIKGASSALYGSSALNGIINIRTAFPSEKKINKNTASVVSRILPGYTKVNMHFGLIDKPKREELNWNGEKRRAFKGIEFLHAMKLNNLDLSLGGNIFLDDGYRFGEVTDRKRFNLNSTYKSKKIEGLSCGLNANFLFQSTGSAIIWNGLDEAYIPLDSSVTTTSGDTYNIDPFITYIKGNNRHSLRTRYLKVINDNSTKGLDAGQDNESEIYYSDYQWQKTLEKYGLMVTMGTTNEIVYARSDLFNGKSNRTNNSLYTQWDKKHGRLNISLGARYENFRLNSHEKYFIGGDSINSFSAGRPIFRTGLNYQLAEATYVRGSWGQGYRFPSMAELFISTEIAKGIWVYPNPSLKPENGWSAEFGIKQGMKAGNWMGYLDVAGFLMQYDDMMEFTFGLWDETIGSGIGFKSINVGKTQISGVELSVSGQGKITNNITMNILTGYTYMKPISLTPDHVYMTTAGNLDLTYNNSSSDSSVLKYRYKHIAKIDAELIYKKLSLGGSLRYNDFMKNIDAIFASELFAGLVPGIIEARENGEDGDVIVDARFGWQLHEMFRFGVIVNNLLNREYMSRPANMMPPRTFAMQLAIKI
ncbi:TonB-dependent receptor [Flavobacteriales bacterium]|nr:TonB-dependent receptor [Flavobacteriales bacterium]